MLDHGVISTAPEALRGTADSHNESTSPPPMTQCPCCGTSILTKLPLIDDLGDTILWKGNRVAVRPREMELFQLLLAAHPALVTYNKLMRTIWPRGQIDDPYSALQVHACNLRTRLAGLNIRLKSKYGKGFRLEIR
jgi:DNA-binding winged helix-turn-helix (wHTH) protein